VARISILIVNFGAYDALDACLASLATHAAGCEVVVVDHGSRAAELARVSHGRAVLAIADSANPGFASGINRAAGIASGDWLLLLNPDCVLETPVPQQLAGWMTAHPDAGAAGPRVREANGTVQASARRFPDWSTFLGGRTSALSRWWPGNPLTRRNLRHGSDGPTEVDWISGACLLVRRDAFDAVGGLDENFFLYWEDADFCRRLRARGWKTYYCPIGEVRHVGGLSSLGAPVRSLVAFHRSAFRYYWKHASWRARLLAPLVLAGLGARLGARLAAGALRGGTRTAP
jgi:GT2 family glycosyltransferase